MTSSEHSLFTVCMWLSLCFTYTLRCLEHDVLHLRLDARRRRSSSISSQPEWYLQTWKFQTTCCPQGRMPVQLSHYVSLRIWLVHTYVHAYRIFDMNNNWKQYTLWDLRTKLTCAHVCVVSRLLLFSGKTIYLKQTHTHKACIGHHPYYLPVNTL